MSNSKKTDFVSERVVYLDYLRVLATFGVIFIHVFSKGYWIDIRSYNWYLNVVGDSLVRWSVPVFVMISGTLFLKPEKDVKLQVILKKYIPRLALAYIFWWLFYSAFCISGDWIVSGEFNTKWLNPHTHLWFLPMMMSVYLLIPLLRKIAADEQLLRYSLILWMIYVSGSFVCLKDFPQITNLLRLNSVIGYAGFFLFGHYLSRKSFDRRQRLWIYVIGVSGALIGVTGNLSVSLYKGEGDGLFLEYLSPHVIMMSAAVFVYVKEKGNKWYKKTRRLVNYVRDDLFGIYLVHALWLIVINQHVIRDMCNQIITLPLITVSIFVFSLYTTKLIRLIPGLRNVVR